MKTMTTSSGTGRARLGLIVSMTVFGTIGLFVRRIEITSAELALCRAGIAAAFLLLYLLATHQRPRPAEIRQSLWLLLASGAAMGINWMLLFGEPLAPIQLVGVVLFLGFAIANELTHKA